MIKTKHKIYLILLAIILIAGATWYVNVYRVNNLKNDDASSYNFIASIPPIKYILSEITGNDFNITTILPSGSSPETYELTPKQLTSISDAELIFTTGLIDFESVLIEKINHGSKGNIIELSKGMFLKSEKGDLQHGTDPHIWTSPRRLKIMAENAYMAINNLMPDSSRYYENYLNLLNKLDNLDSSIYNKIKNSDIKYFLIYHPALSYYSDDYGIEQLPLEVDGKEPSADYLKSIVEKAKNDSIKIILYQKQYDRSVVETIANDIGANPVEFDPMDENIPENLLYVTEMISQQ